MKDEKAKEISMQGAGGWIKLNERPEGLSDLFWMLFVPDSSRPHRQTAHTDSQRPLSKDRGIVD